MTSDQPFVVAGVASPKPLRLAYVLKRFSVKDTSHFAHVMGLLESIAATGAHVRVLVEQSDAAPSSRATNIEFVCLPAGGTAARYWRLLREVRRAVRDGFDAVFVRIALWSCLCAIVATMRTRVRVYFWQSGTVHAYDAAQPWSLAKLRSTLSTRVPFWIVARLADYFVTGPEWMIKYYRDEVGVPERKLRLLYNDVDTGDGASRSDPLQIARARHQLGIASDELVLLFVHRMSPVRRTALYLPDILRSLATVEPVQRFRLLVIGEGSDRGVVEARCLQEGYGQSVQFLGPIPNDSLAPYYTAADVFLHPTYNEGFPRVLIEAMAVGLPVVSTDAGGVHDIVGPLQAKYVVPRDDVSQFGHLLRELCLDVEGRELLRRENLATVQRFSRSKVARMYVDLMLRERDS